MTFLNQHFYTDAGIHLPIEDVKAGANNLSLPDENLSKSNENVYPDELLTAEVKIDDLLEVEKVLSNANITDDVKVNLRNMTKKSVSKTKRYSQTEIPTPINSIASKNKRYSSIYSAAEIMEKTAPSTKRRSLNINTKEFSKIPVSTRNAEGAEDFKNEKVPTKFDEKGITNKKISNLPIPLR